MSVVASAPVVGGVAVVVNHAERAPLYLSRLVRDQRPAVDGFATTAFVVRFAYMEFSVVAVPAAEATTCAVTIVEGFTGFLVVPYRTKEQLTKPNVTEGNAIPVS